MSSYRFCRTDDIALLVDALNRCWAPYVPDEPPMTPEAFKRSIRDLQVWCSSCMVAFEGSDPIGVLIGAKRASATLIHRIAVRPDHRRQGHALHMLTSLSSKLGILGPPRLVAEVPEALDAAGALFRAAGYTTEAVLTDYVLHRDAGDDPGRIDGGLVIPLTVDDLEANGLLGEDHAQVCWERSVETLRARKGDITGLGVASDERIEACILNTSHVPRATSRADVQTCRYTEDAAGIEILSLRSFIEDEGARLKQLLARLGSGPFTLPKVHPAEISSEALEALGFRPAGRHLLYAATAR